jgi:transposase
VHRLRERWVMRRTAVVKQIRGPLLERGLTLLKGRCHLDNALPAILADKQSKLSESLRAVRAMVDQALKALSGVFEELYSATGRASIAPEKLLRALLL